MNQQIGITYSVKGVDQVIAGFERMGKGVNDFLAQMGSVDKIFARIEAAADRFQARMGQIQSTLSQLRYSARAAAPGLGELGRELGTVASQARMANRELSALKTAGVGRVIPALVAPRGGRRGEGIMPTGVGAGRAAAQGNFLGGYGPFGFMARFMLFHQALRAARYGAVDIGMGRSRVEIDKALGELSAVGFSRSQKQATEIAGQEWATKYGNLSAVDYATAMNQTASAFSVQKLGIGILQQMNEAALVTGKLSKMSPEAAAEMQSKQLNAYLSAQPASVYGALQSGERADVKGFGNVNLGEMSQKYAAMTSKAVQISNIWGKGIMDFAQYAGPVMASQGWDPAGILAYAGALVDVGFKGSRSGRAMKSVMVGGPENYARLLMDQEGRLNPKARGAQRAAQEDEVRQRAAGIRGIMSDPMRFAEFLGTAIGPAMKHAQKMSQDPKYSRSLVKDYGFSKDFLPVMEAISKGGFVERLKDFYTKISNAQFSEALGKMEESVNTVGHAWTRMAAAGERVATSIAGSRAFLNAMGTTTGFMNKISSFFEKRNTVDTAVKQIEKWRRPPTGDGLVTDPSQFKSMPEVRDEINKMMREQFSGRLRGLGPVPGEDASEFAKQEYREKKRALYDEVLGFGMETFKRSMGVEDYRFGTGLEMAGAIAGTEAFGQKVWEAGAAVSAFTGRMYDFVTKPPTQAGQIPQPDKPGFPDTIMPFYGQPAGYTPGGGDVVSVLTQILSVLMGSQSAGQLPSLKVLIGDREIHDVVYEAIAERDMRNRNQWGHVGA